ncbi:MAG: DNA repair protein RecO [Candidatus Zixiibacteriota bacterium]
MALDKTEAIVLKAFNWSESSRTVVFFSREFGKLPLTDKGGRRLISKRGRLVPFARLEITFYSSEKETNGYVSDVELLEALTFEKDGTLGRLAYGSAACELLYLLLPDEEPQGALYSYFLAYLRMDDICDKHGLPGLFIAFFLRTLSQLGYHPSLAYCVGCGKDFDETGANGSEVLFSPERGGRVCPACQRVGEYYIGLSPEGYATLCRLQTASLTEAVAEPLRYADAARLVETLTKFLSYQAGIKSDLKSLEFLEKLRTTHLSPENKQP